VRTRGKEEGTLGALVLLLTDAEDVGDGRALKLRLGAICQLGSDDEEGADNEEDDDCGEEAGGMEKELRSAIVEARVAADSAVRVSSSIAARSDRSHTRRTTV
jgi:hypothetical protein